MNVDKNAQPSRTYSECLFNPEIKLMLRLLEERVPGNGIDIHVSLIEEHSELPAIPDALHIAINCPDVYSQWLEIIGKQQLNLVFSIVRARTVSVYFIVRVLEDTAAIALFAAIGIVVPEAFAFLQVK